MRSGSIQASEQGGSACSAAGECCPMNYCSRPTAGRRPGAIRRSSVGDVGWVIRPTGSPTRSRRRPGSWGSAARTATSSSRKACCPRSAWADAGLFLGRRLSATLRSEQPRWWSWRRDSNPEPGDYKAITSRRPSTPALRICQGQKPTPTPVSAVNRPLGPPQSTRCATLFDRNVAARLRSQIEGTLALHSRRR